MDADSRTRDRAGMTETRWRKIVADLAKRRARTLLTLFGLSLAFDFRGIGGNRVLDSAQ
jgi:hypothetical protein